MYDHSMDKKGNKWLAGEKLKTLNIKEMPEYIISNLEKYKAWLDLEIEQI